MELHCKVCGKESYTMERGTTNFVALRHEQRRLVLPVGHIEPRAVRGQQVDHAGLVVVGRAVQRGVAPRVLRVEIEAELQILEGTRPTVASTRG